MKYFNIFF